MIMLIFLEPGPLLSRIFLLSFVGFAWVSEQYPMVLNYRGWGCFCVFFWPCSVYIFAAYGLPPSPFQTLPKFGTSSFSRSFPTPPPGPPSFYMFFQPWPSFSCCLFAFFAGPYPSPSPPALPDPSPPPSPTPLFNSKSMNSVSVLVSGQAEAGGAALGLNGGGVPPNKNSESVYLYCQF